MSVRNQHSRQSKSYMFKEIGSINFMFCIGSFATMSQVRYAAKKAAEGKLTLDDSLRGVYVNGDGSINQFAL